VLDRSLDRFAHAVSVGVAADRNRWHSLIETDHESVERDANCDHAEASRRHVCEAERENERVREHQQPVADGIELVCRERDDLEQDLKSEADRENPSGSHGQSPELGEAAGGQDHDKGRGSNRQHQEPHAGNASDPIRGGTGLRTMPRWPS